MVSRRRFLIAAGAPLVAVAAACAGPSPGSRPATATGSAARVAGSAELARFAFIGQTLLHRTFGGMTIEGQIRNPTDGPWTVTVSAVLIDGTGKVAGTVEGIVSDVQPGQTKPYLLQSDHPPASIAGVTLTVKSAIAGRLVPKFQIDGVTLTRGDAGLVVVGQLTNPETVPHSMTLIATFWDGEGRLVGAAESELVKVGGSETRPFAIGVTDDVSAYRVVRVEVDTLVD